MSAPTDPTDQPTDPPSDRPALDESPLALVERLEARLAPLEVEAGRAWWDASVDASPTHDERRVAAEMACLDALSDPEDLAAVTDALRSAGVPSQGAAGLQSGEGAMTVRRLTLLRDAMVPTQGPPEVTARIVALGAEVDSAFSAFRPTFEGRSVDDNDLAEVLRISHDVARRRAAWEASKQVGAHVADRVLELVRLRNDLARSLGYRDHVELGLSTAELDETALFALLDEVDAVTAEPFAAWRSELDDTLAARFGCRPDELRPWHHDNVFFQAPPALDGLDLDAWFADADLVALTEATFAGIGLDVAPIVANSDLWPRPGKNQHAFCADLDRAGDIRVLANVVANEEWAEVLLHEMGHAVYDLGIDHALPWGLRTCHPLTTEGVAMMFEKLVREPGWLATVAGVPADEVAARAPALDAARRANLLTLVRWVLVVTHFERGLYADPDADHDTRWWDLVERFQLVRRPDDRAAPDWAAKIHLASAPVYYQNYLLGELVALQLRATIDERFGGIVGRPEVGAFLRSELFAPGASRRWDDLIETVTGHPLTARHLVEALAPAAGFGAAGARAAGER